MKWTWWALGNRPLVFPCGFVLFGVLFAPQLEWPAWLPIATVCALCLASLLWAPRTGAGLALLLACIALGIAIGILGLEVDVPSQGTAVLEGEVEAVKTRRTHQTLYLAASKLNSKPVRFRAALSTDNATTVLPGQLIRVEARLKPVAGPRNPGEWNHARWAMRRGQPVTGGFDARRLVKISKPPAWRRFVANQHASLKARASSVTHDADGVGLFLTLAAGERAELGDRLEEDFARSGLAHVLSVSGLHVAALALFVFSGLRWLLSRWMISFIRRREPRAWAGAMSIPLLWGYVVFTGLQAPAVRSAIMCTMLLSAYTFRRRSDALNALAGAGLLMMLVDPAAPFSLSVQLSFLAVLSLILLAPRIRTAMPISIPNGARSRWISKFIWWREVAVQTIAASIAVTLSTSPLILTAFHRISFIGLISNVVTLPLSGLLSVLAASTAVLHVVITPLAYPTLWLGVQLSRLFVKIATAFSALPGASLWLSAPQPWLAAIWWMGLVFFVFGNGRWRMLACIAPAAAAVHVLLPLDAFKSTVNVTFLAVGHGDAIVISSRGQHALIDGGGVPKGYDTGKRFVLPFLRQQRVHHIELAALSHAHLDHTLGMATTLEKIPTHHLWLPKDVGRGPLVQLLLDSADTANVQEVEAGHEPFALGDARLEVLGPSEQLYGENDRSMVLLLRHGDVRFLLTGDIEAAGEALIHTGAVTVLKAPHHGSNTSSTPDFVQKTQPQYVVFCVSRWNRFSLPRKEIVERYEAVGARCYHTGINGAIQFRSDGRDVDVEVFEGYKLPKARGRRIFL